MPSTSDPLFGKTLIRRQVIAAQNIQRLMKNRLAVAGLGLLALLVLCAILAPYVTPYDPIAMDTPQRFQPPSLHHLMGTDQFGRDLFTRILFGTRISLGVGIISVGMASIIGTVIGLAAGYYGGILDLVVSYTTDVLFAFPAILLAIAMMAVLGQNLVNVMLAIGIVNTPIFARVVRVSTFSVSARLYIEAARSVGMSSWRVMVRHVLPNCLPVLIVQTTVAFAWAVIAESALSFLGLGPHPPTPSWGLILDEGRDVLEYAPWQAIFAGLMIMLAVFSLNVVGDGLRDALDPHLRSYSLNRR